MPDPNVLLGLVPLLGTTFLFHLAAAPMIVGHLEPRAETGWRAAGLVAAGMLGAALVALFVAPQAGTAIALLVSLALQLLVLARGFRIGAGLAFGVMVLLRLAEAAVGILALAHPLIPILVALVLLAVRVAKRRAIRYPGAA
ncbi:MAG TPA: hypothetical protein RMH85_19760 [Polyangiaceae bacterium LLY-WYZ-15_(1-7)]|nr:hypothetical protein [Myxococcales bacterium]MAT26136.1 hypothetical protein [Sandaracinus sp.]HJK90209.1 hypothetical protein [Polyangiaceae bacterium LLY-WYZ-15_(1-7)]MBJ73470.1 hypothetical protein [Sandaracinus sp.]HJL00493.1 hypothetical protein [Polyangiaceae bacterium LLY-WYZ-15_(1-7)]